MSETVCGLDKKRCVPCEGGAKPLSADEAKKLLQDTPGWSLNDDSKEMQREFRFKNYYETISFVNAVAWMAHQEDHHPDLEVAYSRCLVRYSTHAIGGLSENDFICAAKINNLLDNA